MLRSIALAGCLTTALMACGSGSTPDAAGDRSSGTRPAPATESGASRAAGAATTAARRVSRRGVVGTLVRFTGGGVNVDVTIRSDNPTTRDFLSLLPLRLSVEELSGAEKISYLPRKLRTSGSRGSNPRDGDLIYYKPWGNLGFYYDASGVGFSDDTINLGTYRASPRTLGRLQRGRVTVRVVDKTRRP